MEAAKGAVREVAEETAAVVANDAISTNFFSLSIFSLFRCKKPGGI